MYLKNQLIARMVGHTTVLLIFGKGSCVASTWYTDSVRHGELANVAQLASGASFGVS